MNKSICGEILLRDEIRHVCIETAYTEHDHDNARSRPLKKHDVTYFDLASGMEFLEH